MRLTELATPLKPLEAMAQGRLFVASDVGGHKELIRDGETGKLFRAGSAEALAAAIDDMLDHRASAGRRRARRGGTSWKTCATGGTGVANYGPVYVNLAT